MAQARTLSAAEFEQLLAHIDTRKYAVRNRCMMLLTHWAGLRIGEVACLRWSDVVTPDGAVKAEIRLLPDMTKGRHPRTVFINGRLREELETYAAITAVWTAVTHCSPVRKAYVRDLAPTAWPRPSPCSMPVLG